MGAEGLEREGVAGDRDRGGRAAGRVDREARQIGAGVEKHFLLIVRTLGEQLDSVRDLEAQAAERAPTVVLGQEADPAARIVEQPVAAPGPGGHGRAAHRREGEVAILILAHQSALAEIQAAQPVRRAAGRTRDEAARSLVGDSDLEQGGQILWHG